MINVGIICSGDNGNAMDLLVKLYTNQGLCVYTKKKNKVDFNINNEILQADSNNFDVAILQMDFEQLVRSSNKTFNFHTILYLDGIDGLDSEPLFIENSPVVVINSDDKKTMPFSVSPKTTLISCGFNQKACVTASSIISNGETETIQCCIQRTINTISGEILEPQEFTVNVEDRKNNITEVLATVTAAIANDTEISELNLSLL